MTMLKPTKPDLILDGAIAEFLERGYAAASMDRIAARAGVSKATVYSHFQSKENLFVALIERLVKSKFLVLLEPGQIEAVVDVPPDVFLRELATKILEQPSNDPDLTNFMRMVVGESGRFPELAKAFVSALTATGLRSLTFYFKACPHLEIADPEATARVFVGAIAHFIITQHILYGAEIIPMAEERLINTLVDLITG
ncbi:MAG: TetR/AcrR family transcriptional regulator [Spirulina sp. SIO3F2]|nr:TetR/AcrR family transcriptional regulator [Spirulina sp. SIO3F2]